jgi:TRAP-type C4-dicarboxylate transport system substrate-binding protein
MRKALFLLLLALMASGLTLLSPGQPLAADSAVVLKAVAFLPANNANVAGFDILANKINNKFKDKVKIQIVGGPEVIPPFQLHEAVKSGAIDMCLTSCGYYPSLVWEAQAAMFSNKTFQEIAQTEFFDIMSKLHKDAGLVWLGAGTIDDVFYIYTNPVIKSPQDFSGKKIRIFPPFIPLMNALKAVPINLPMGDIYTAMERGAVDGFVQSPLGFVTDFSWHEVTKYLIKYPLYQATAVVLANPKSWGKISPDLQREIIEFKKKEIDPAVSLFYRNLGAERLKLMMDKGVKPLEFSPQDGAAFLKVAYDSAWNQVSAKSPELGPKLKKMLVK